MRVLWTVALVFMLGAVALFFYVLVKPNSPIQQEANMLFTDIGNTESMAQASEARFELTSSAFEHNTAIPARYTCDGEGVNPPLSISGVPANAQSLVLLMEDPDIPEAIKKERGIAVYDHWVLFNLPVSTTVIGENSNPLARMGVSSNNAQAYIGPCPPAQYDSKEHRYVFTLYALDVALDVPEGSTKTEVLAAMEGHILQETSLIGMYARK